MRIQIHNTDQTLDTDPHWPKPRIWIRIETNEDPQHWLGRTDLLFVLLSLTIYNFFWCSESEEEEEEEEPREKRSKAAEGEDGFWGSARPYEEQQEEKRKERERKRHQDGQDADGWECVANTHSRKPFFI